MSSVRCHPSSSTVLGPAAGGCRRWQYVDSDAVAELESYVRKWSAQNLPESHYEDNTIALVSFPVDHYSGEVFAKLLGIEADEIERWIGAPNLPRKVVVPIKHRIAGQHSSCPGGFCHRF